MDFITHKTNGSFRSHHINKSNDQLMTSFVMFSILRNKEIFQIFIIKNIGYKIERIGARPNGVLLYIHKQYHKKIALCYIKRFTNQVDTYIYPRSQNILIYVYFPYRSEVKFLFCINFSNPCNWR